MHVKITTVTPKRRSTRNVKLIEKKIQKRAKKEETKERQDQITK